MSNILQPKIKSHSLHNCCLFQQKLHVDVILFVLRIGGFFAELDSYIHCLYSSSADFISSYLYMQDDLANAGWLTHLPLRFSLKPDLVQRNNPLGSFLLWGAVLKFDILFFQVRVPKYFCLWSIVPSDRAYRIRYFKLFVANSNNFFHVSV